MAVTWGFAAAGLAGALAGQHGYYWVTPLVFGVLALGLTRLAKTRLSPERELPNESPEAEKVREPSIWDEPSDSWGFGDKEERF